MLPQNYNQGNTFENETVKRFLPLVSRLANRMSLGLPKHVDIDDLISGGIMGLLDALEKYDPSKGPLKNYVALRVKGAMVDELRRNSWFPRSLLAKKKEIDRVYSLLCTELKRPPTEAELARRMGISLKELSLLFVQINNHTVVHLQDYLFPSEEETSHQVEDSIADPTYEHNPEENFLKMEQSRMLAAAIDTLSEKERLVLQLYYGEELTLKEIGQILNVSESRISQIHSKIMLKLRCRLKEV